MPVLGITAVGKEMVRDARYLALASRIAAEIGAHMVKTYYCAEDFEKVVEGCPVPIVIAGANLTISSSSGSEFHNVQITPSLTCDSQNSWLMTPFQSEGKVFNVGLIVKKCD